MSLSAERKLTISTGWQPKVQHQPLPGSEANLEPQPLYDQVPTWDGGAKLYQAAGKLEGRKAVITGGDSGIGRSSAILFAMEGADVLIAYLEDEEKDAQETKKQVEKYGRKCYLFPTDLRKKENCDKVIDEAMHKLGAVNILFNNHAYQMMKETILEITDEQWLNTFDTNIHRKYQRPIRQSSL
jgi:short-subunit dehydrogenase involved in D-alanine esterification of teichoic acids